jgi:hypothetical protein
MKSLFSCIFILNIVFSFAQDLKEVVKYYPNSKQIKEKYFVLKKNNSVKQGQYIEYYQIREADCKKNEQTVRDSNLIKTKGFFENNLKQGLWMIYNRPSGFISNWFRGEVKEKGKYNQGKKVGIWQKFQNGLIEQYDNDNQKFIEPILNFNVPYPRTAQDQGIEDDVIISYNVNQDCSFSNFQIVSGKYKILNDDAIKWIQVNNETYKKYMQKVSPCTPRIQNQLVRYKLQ